MNKTYRSLFVALLVLVTILAGCGSSETSETSSEGGLTPVTLQLKWVPQAQFAGYFVA
ncbi:myristoyl transferase, partial [Butyricicoccus sp. 1XD8-22]